MGYQSYEKRAEPAVTAQRLDGVRFEFEVASSAWLTSDRSAKMILLTTYIVYFFQYCLMLAAAVSLFFGRIHLFFAFAMLAYAPGMIASRLVPTKAGFNDDIQASAPRIPNLFFKLASYGLIAVGSLSLAGFKIPYWSMLDAYLLFAIACFCRDCFLFRFISKRWRDYIV